MHRQQNLFTQLPTCESESAVGLEREGREGGREEGPTEWHSGKNLFNLLLHLPAAETRPEPHPVACREKATKDGDENELVYE